MVDVVVARHVHDTSIALLHLGMLYLILLGHSKKHMAGLATVQKIDLSHLLTMWLLEGAPSSTSASEDAVRSLASLRIDIEL